MICAMTRERERELTDDIDWFDDDGDDDDVM